MDIYEGKVMVSESLMTGIADSIRRKTGTSNYIQTPSMPGMIDGIVTEPTLQEKSVSLDGSDDTNMDILPDEGYDGLSKVTIAVTGGGPMVDGGFVVNFYNAESQLIQTNSAVCGMFIDSPVSYECDGWKDTDELTVELPITSDEAEAVIDLYPIFLEYEEYSVVLADYPIDYRYNCAPGQVGGLEVKYYDEGYHKISIKAQDVTPDDPDNDLITCGIIAYIKGLPTNKNNRMRIKYSTENGVAAMWLNEDAGSSENEIVTLNNVNDNYLTFDVDGDTVDLYVRIGSMSTTIYTTLTISEIYFYHENE